MKRPIAACLLIIGCAALVGCGTLNRSVKGPDRAHHVLPGHADGSAATTLWEIPIETQGRLHLNLGIENLNERPTDFQLGGDDEATLNAYAACLTMKVSF